MKDKFYFMLTY